MKRSAADRAISAANDLFTRMGGGHWRSLEASRRSFSPLPSKWSSRRVTFLSGNSERIGEPDLAVTFMKQVVEVAAQDECSNFCNYPAEAAACPTGINRWLSVCVAVVCFTSCELTFEFFRSCSTARNVSRHVLSPSALASLTRIPLIRDQANRKCLA